MKVASLATPSAMNATGSSVSKAVQSLVVVSRASSRILSEEASWDSCSWLRRSRPASVATSPSVAISTLVVMSTSMARVAPVVALPSTEAPKPSYGSEGSIEGRIKKVTMQVRAGSYVDPAMTLSHPYVRILEICRKVETPRQITNCKDDEVTALARGTYNNSHTDSRAKPARGLHSKECLDYAWQTTRSGVACESRGDVIRQWLC